MSDAIPLPPRPSLEQYKKLAKDLQNACESAEPGAVRLWAARWVDKVTPEMRNETARIEQRWHTFRNSDLRAERCSLTGAQFFIAREHGFASWPKFATHVEALARANSSASNFEAAADAIVGGDAPALRKLLRDHPELVRERSAREHRSTLLHYVSANGIEDFRQKTPPDIVDIANMLLDAGADVNAESDAYGGGATTLGLVATSAHPERAGVQIALLETLLARGAKMDQPSAAGNGHSLIHGCLANGQPKAAEFLASRGAPLDLEAAAGLGRLAIVRSYFDENGALRPHASRRDMEAALESACWYGRTEVVEFLLDRGIDPAICNAAGQTGLHCAAYGAYTDVVRLLIERGCPVSLAENNYHATTPILGVILFVASDKGCSQQVSVNPWQLFAGPNGPRTVAAWSN